MTTASQPGRRALALALGALLATSPPATARAQNQATAPGSSKVLLRVSGRVETPLRLTAADLAAMPRRTLKASDHRGREATFEGVALHEVLARAGVASDQALRGEALTQYLVVQAADGYRAVFALPELDPAFTDRLVLLADRRDGRPLADPEGPLRLVVPDEKRHARWVRQVVALTVHRHQPDPGQAPALPPSPRAAPPAR